MVKKKSKPKFNVMNDGFMKSVKSRWRKPRGIDNKKRIRCAFAGASPRVGYGNASEIKGRHPCGKKEVLVRNLNQLASLQNAKDAVMIAGAVGKQKREMILAKAKAMGLKVLNA